MSYSARFLPGPKNDMRNFKINTGGIIGALCGAALLGLVFFAAQDVERPNGESPARLTSLIILGAVAGNTLWSKFVAKPDVSSADEDDLDDGDWEDGEWNEAA